MDFSRLSSSPRVSSLLAPRDIFAALPARTHGYSYLRDVQGQVLDAWFARRTERDLAVKMNTGAGKTLVGLLVLQSCLNEQLGPALYVTPSPYLADQVQAQAALVGVPVTNDPESASYMRGEAVGIVNIHRLANGLSIFGGPGSHRARPVRIGSLVIDDAHAALASIEAQSTTVIPSSHAAYGRVLALFATDLRQQSASAFADIESSEPTATLRVPFWTWADKETEIVRILHEHADDDALKFTFPLVREALRVTTAVFSGDALEIRPPFPPIELIRSFAESGRRIYLSATLSDDTVLVSHFDADARSVQSPIAPPNASDLGDRLILAPQEITPVLRDHEIRGMVRRLADDKNTVVLVPSYRRAEYWVNEADLTVGADEIAGAVERLRAGHVGLVVLVNKYDGIDLPEDACRVLVVDGVPEAYGAIERRAAVVWGETDAMVSRQVQRIEQGMGRGVRSADDHCVVLLTGSHLTQLLADPRNQDHLSPATLAQLRLSQQVARGLSGKDDAAIEEVVRQVLSRDQTWIAASRAELAGVRYGPGSIQTDTVHARRAFSAAVTGQYGDAVAHMRLAVTAATSDRARGARLEEQAVYQHQVDPAAAQLTLAAALAANRYVTKPIHGIQYARITDATRQGHLASQYLKRLYGNPNDLVLGITGLIDRLAWDADRTDDFEAAFAELGSHLGFTVQRPDKESGSGPDVLWAAAGQHFYVIECKSGATADRISRRDLAQLGQSATWFDAQYGRGAERVPTIVHPAGQYAHDATPPPECRAVDRASLESLADDVRTMAVALATSRSWDQEAAVSEQLRDRNLLAAVVITAHSVAPRRARS